MKITKKVFLSSLFLVALLCVSDLFVFAAVRSTNNLRQYENNMDTLKDKEGSLHQILEELQGFTTRTTTGCAPGGNITGVDGITTDDTVISAIVVSSANLVSASTTTKTQTLADGSQSSVIEVRSRLWGAMGNNVRLTFTQISSAPTNPGVLSVATTGYAIEVKLSTGQSSAYYSSATMVCNAINTDPTASQLVDCFVTQFATATFLPIAQLNLTNGAGAPLSQHYVPGNFFTISSSQTITTSTSAPIANFDGIIFNIFNRPDQQ